MGFFPKTSALIWWYERRSRSTARCPPPEKVADCDVNPHVPSECSVPCDDGCPNKENVHGYGGWQTLTRSILFRANKLSVRCPGLTRKRKCNQFKMAAVLRRMRRWLVGTVASGDGSYPRNGKCPKGTSKIRFGIKKCNTHEWTGEEVCIAKHDLVLAIDGSGSLRESVFKLLKTFAAGLIDKS